MLKRFCKWCTKWIEKGNNNSFCVDRGDQEVFRVPVTLLVVLLLFAFWVVVPLLVVGLFLNLRYRFVGPDIKVVDIDINRAMDGAAETADNIKSEFSSVSKEKDQ